MSIVRHAVALLSAILVSAGAASSLDLQSTTVPGRTVPSLTNGEIGINRADRRGFFKNVDGSIGGFDLLNATAPGRAAVEQSFADLLTAPLPGNRRVTLSAMLANLPIYPSSYGAKCDGGTTGVDEPAYEAAAAYALSSGRPLEIGNQGIACIFNRPVQLSGAITIAGRGQSSCLIVGLHNGPLFVWDFPTSAERFGMSGCTLRGQYAADADYSLTRAIKFTGPDSSLVQHGQFADLAFQGMLYGVENATGITATQFGQESRFSFITWDRITLLPGARSIQAGWYYPKGSGTGSTYKGLKTKLGPDGAVLKFTGTGNTVVGDIIVDGHFAGQTSSMNAYVVDIGPSTVYRSEIKVDGQLDAGMKAPFKIASDLPYADRLSYAATNVGGNVDLGAGLPPVSGVFDDQMVSRWSAGVFHIDNATGGKTVPIYAVTIGNGRNGQAFNGLSCRIIASGLIGNVGPRVTSGEVLLTQDTGIAGAPVFGPMLTSGGSSYSFAGTSSGAVTTLSVVYPAGASNSFFDAQIVCSGGPFSVARL